MRTKYDKDLQVLKEMLITMGENTSELIKVAIESLEEQNIEKAEMAIQLDDAIDELEYEIEQKCLFLIMLQQPVGRDLRKIGTILKVITDLERIADYGVNIAEVTLAMKDEKLIRSLVDIPKMTEVIEEMLDSSMKSFVDGDIKIAKSIAEMDDKVDSIYQSVYEDLITIIANDSSKSKQVMNLLLVARHLERIADHITNICERIIYMVTSNRVKIN